MSTPSSRITLFASGNGSNAEKIITYFDNHSSIKVVALFSNNPRAFALTRAERLGIPTVTFNREAFNDPERFSGLLQQFGTTHIVLAGFLWLMPDYLIKEYPSKIINIHPALLPKYGGKGMFGLKVHEAVKNASETQTGITIHLINEKYDEGEILFQERCDIGKDYTPHQIAECVQQLEYEHYPKVIEKWVLNR